MQKTKDIFIVGGGYVGLACALSFALKGFSVALCDPRLSVSLSDKRAFLMAAAAKRLLVTLGVWNAIAPTATVVEKMVVTDSKLNDLVRPSLLEFSGDVLPNEPFGHMVEQGVLMQALLTKASSCAITLLESAFKSFEGKTITLENGESLEAMLLIGADGANSLVRQQAHINVVRHAYSQSAIVATLSHEKPHLNTAYEHFLPSGPFATLPLSGNRSSLVWTEESHKAQKLLKLPQIMLEDELQTRFAFHLGEVKLLDTPRLFPLSVQLSRSFIANRIALIGDAAHVIHPIAGQGVNLGLKDVVTLVACVEKHAKLGLDFGLETYLSDYQTARRTDSLVMAGTTDMLNRLFSNENSLLTLARDTGLSLVNRINPLKNAFIRRAAGV